MPFQIAHQHPYHAAHLVSSDCQHLWYITEFGCIINACIIQYNNGKFWKFVKNWQSCHHEFGVLFFGTQYTIVVVSTYPALETLTEPHRLVASLQCTVSVSRSMLASARWFPEGRLHVIPLMNLSLPGIDPNDIKKSLVS